ncbi:acyl carrier protein [Streptomyces xanthochromogenes]|uniref:Acyl carrier protein n=1 Tax=Streptomyces xanthochromogenes TaxID=67384 RepID=A0ABQ2ZGY5_9ACTN|nr:acyl carrier protein [Streptomyces xanthochromogenes]GGY15946.1 acyl carrier protein [Streptomyces xanthochromogenes]
MANNTDILNTLTEIVAEVAGVDSAQVTTEKSFIDDLDIDSLSMVEITVALEDRFAVKFPDDRIAELKTVGETVSYIAAHR